VALGRAIVRTPKLFLMDEPLSNLDAKLRVQMRAEIKHLQRELGVTTIYVTHDQVEAMTLADRVAVMAGGRLQQVGAPLEIYNWPCNVFVAGFLGNPSMNLVKGQVVGGRFLGPGFTLAAKGLPDGPTTLGQRPEDMAVVHPDDGDFRAEVFTAEQLGDSTLVTVRLGAELVAIRADKACPARIGEVVGVGFGSGSLHFFATGGGERLEGRSCQGRREV
jgi:multiple sugar transport system ATP-binding protein